MAQLDPDEMHPEALKAGLRRWIDGDALRRMDQFSRLGAAVTRRVLDSAGLQPDERTGIVFGTVWGPIDSTVRYYVTLAEQGPGQASPLLLPNTAASSLLGRLARIFGARGPSCMMSGGNPVETACGFLTFGQADAMVVGEIEVGARPPEDNSQRFTINPAGGTAAAIVLETTDHHRQRQGRFLARVAQASAGFALANGNQCAAILDLTTGSHCSRLVATLAALAGRPAVADRTVEVTTVDHCSGLWSRTRLEGAEWC